ncbi:nucleoside triphosphate hydrolase [Thalassospira sp. MA62]|nr:nucleoside triphosphate hydrolase [Thalassospira sp. MA62]
MTSAPTLANILGDLSNRISAVQSGNERVLVAITGAPASGKSTLTEQLRQHMGGDGAGVAIVPMDGFHFDDAILDANGTRARKGAPHTFDVNGLYRTLCAIRSDDQDVYVPVFDRKIELSRAAARGITPHHRIILIEGNYLLLDQAPWDKLGGLFDLSIYLDVPEDTLRHRLIARWHEHGFDAASAITKAERNDLPNAQTVRQHSKTADIVLS